MVLLLVGLIAWGSVFIWRTSFSLFDGRYFVLFDDAMISMAYARNLAAGDGLVWSRGSEPVEGFTNPLWTGAMTAIHVLPIVGRHRSAAIQILGLALLAATVLRSRALLRSHFPGAESAAGWLPAALLTAFTYTLAYWSLFGMETALQALLAVLSVQVAYDIVYAERDRHFVLFVIFALAYLVRMDMAILVLVVGAWVTLHGGFRRRAWRQWIAGATLLAIVVAGYQVFRVVYFGEWLPNTYHLKLGGVPLDLRLARGAAKLLGTVRATWAVWLGVALAVISSRQRPSRTLLPVLLLLCYAGYSVWVGGDVWELPEVNLSVNRFVVFVLPLGFVAINDLFNRIGARLPRNRRNLLVAIATSLLFLTTNGLLLSPRAGENWRRTLLVDRPLFVESHALVLSNLQRLQTLVEPGAEVVTYWAGIPAFFSRYRLIDAMGYTDPHIARKPLPREVHWTFYAPGHLKRDPLYLLARRPDAFFQFWDIDELPVRWPRHHMRWNGYVQVGEFWLRRDSPHLRPHALSR